MVLLQGRQGGLALHPRAPTSHPRSLLVGIRPAHAYHDAPTGRPPTIGGLRLVRRRGDAAAAIRERCSDAGGGTATRPRHAPTRRRARLVAGTTEMIRSAPQAE